MPVRSDFIDYCLPQTPGESESVRRDSTIPTSKETPAPLVPNPVEKKTDPSPVKKMDSNPVKKKMEVDDVDEENPDAYLSELKRNEDSEDEELDAFNPNEDKENNADWNVISNEFGVLEVVGQPRQDSNNLQEESSSKAASGQADEVEDDEDDEEVDLTCKEQVLESKYLINFWKRCMQGRPIWEGENV